MLPVCISAQSDGRRARPRLPGWVRPRGALLPALVFAVGLVAVPLSVGAQAMPEHLADGPDVHYQSATPGHHGFDDSDGYRGLLAAGYLLALPAAAMTGGVGMLLPVGMHYHSDNPAGGNRAALGILGGIGLGGVVGGFIGPPGGEFRITRSMIGGALAGFFLWGVVDVAFFAHTDDGERDFSLTVDTDGRASLGLRMFGTM